MDISSVVNSALTQTSRAQPGKDGMGVAVLKTALEQQEHTVTQLVESVPKAPNLPHMGNNIDVKA